MGFLREARVLNNLGLPGQEVLDAARHDRSVIRFIRTLVLRARNRLRFVLVSLQLVQRRAGDVTGRHSPGTGSGVSTFIS